MMMGGILLAYYGRRQSPCLQFRAALVYVQAVFNSVSRR